ncbi:MAG: hypothetical protein COA79_07515 [Planctomycetota bacterium]|nr:MAG: hypothetical protein COA79_07515 [Planctomycetota bacterium]
MFIHFAFLAGLGLTAIPIIIHILQKNRVKEMEWAAMKFLLEIVEEQNKKIQLEDLLLLILRVLMFIFLVLGIARPIMSISSAGLLDSNGQIVILMDDSYSMSTREGLETRFDNAKKRAIKLLENQPKGYGVSIVRFNQYSTTLTGGFSVDHELLKQTVTKMKPGFLKGNIENGLDYAIRLFTKDEGKKVIFLISDFQEKDWASAGADLTNRIKELNGKIEFTFIPVTDSIKENVAVESVTSTQSAVKLGEKATIIGVLRNYGKEVAKDQNVDFLVNGSLVESSIASIPPGQTAKIIFSYVPEESGDQRIEVKLRHDKVEPDNSSFFTLKVVDQLRVLGVLDESSIGLKFHEITMADMALNPFPLASKDERALYKFEYIGISSLASVKLSDYDFVLIANVRDITGIDAKPLEDYVKQGGGVIMFLGPNVKLETYNNNLYKDGEGLWSFPLSEQVAESEKDKALEFNGENKEHPIWQFILSEGRNYLTPFKVFKSFTFDVKENTKAIVLGTVKSDKMNIAKPCLVDFSYGAGHVIVYGSSSNMKWGRFPIHPSFVAFMHQSFKYLKSFSSSSSNLSIYAEYKKKVGLEESQASYQLIAPSGSAYTLSVLGENDIYELKIDSSKLSEHGFYKLVNLDDKTKESFLSINLDVSEGDISCMQNGAIESSFKPLGVNVDLSGGELSVALNNIDPITELAFIFLILAFICWVAENLLGYRITKRS